MSNWVAIITDIRRELNLGDWGNVPESAWSAIAKRCGPAEVADIEQRLVELQVAKIEIPDWDGDAADNIRRAERLFKGVLTLISNRG